MTKRVSEQKKTRVSVQDWGTATPEERSKWLSDQAGDGPRDVVDQAFAADTEQALADWLAGVLNVIGPRQGYAASTDPETGEDIPGAGDPTKWYARTREAIEIPMGPGMEEPPNADAVAVLGTWSGDTLNGEQA